jgi:type IV pilus assembly protein PilQ
MRAIKTSALYFFIIILLLSQAIFAQMQFKQKKAPQNISLDFQKAPTQDVLKWLTKFTDKNIVLSQLVQGNITIHLKNVAWQQAMNAILSSQGLGQKTLGNIIYIAPLVEITKYTQQQQELTEKVPLHTSLIRLKYAEAENVGKLLTAKGQGFLSSRGRIVTDNRTNSLLIHDTQEQLNELRKYIDRLDIQVPQVLIEARIVNIDEDYERELGIRFGLTGGGHISGTLKGANELAGGKSPSSVPFADRLNVDLPALSSNAVHLGMALFKIAKGTLLDLELSALESEGHAEVITNPHLITANQQTAVIEAGEEIPYQESVAQGVTSTAFKKAVLKLQVTPQITSNNKIILHLKVNQDKRSSKEVKGVPAIDTRYISTQVLVDNGQTIVLGGIYEHTKTSAVERVPFLSALPVLGALFRYNKKIDTRRESLIFVTPKII